MKTKVDLSAIDRWHEKTYYLVEAAFSEVNPIAKYVFYSGFLDNGNPGAYSYFSMYGNCNYRFNDCVYIKPLKMIASEEDMHSYSGSIRLVRDL